jgi:hypothetical protein
LAAQLVVKRGLVVSGEHALHVRRLLGLVVHCVSWGSGVHPAGHVGVRLHVLRLLLLLQTNKRASLILAENQE